MIWIAYIAGCLAGVVGLMAVIGLALPRAHVAARRTTLPAPPGDVWRALTDLENQVGWRRDLREVVRVSPTSFRERTTQGSITFEITTERPPELRITTIADEELPFGGRWIYELAPASAGTQLTITEDGFVKNPLFRFLSRTVFSTASTMERFLADLSSHFAGAAPIEAAEPSPRARPPT
jgi:hypothetical protein